MADKAQELKDTPQNPVDRTPQGVVASPEGKEPSPKVYTQEQVDKLTQMASMKAGRDRKAIETERDTLKGKATDYENKIMAIEQERETLQKQIDDLGSQDPDKFALIKKDRELREGKRELQEGKRELQSSLTALEADKQSYSQQISEAKELDTLVNIYLVSEQFEGGDADRLADLCEKFGAETEEEIKSVAETLWSKREEETPSMATDSGRTSGGTISDEQATLNRLYPSMAKK